jgi:hypothetical protein
MTLGLLWSTNAAKAASFTPQNTLSISPLSSVFTGFYDIPKSDKSTGKVAGEIQESRQNLPD